MKIIAMILVSFLILIGCGSKKDEAKPAAETKKEEKPPADLVEDVARQPDWPAAATRTLQGAKETKEQIDQQKQRDQQILEQSN